MTLTHTVQSFAHDAASTAGDLGSQAAELGSRAAEIGSDAASSVASAAANLALAIGKKVPGVQPKRKAAPWRLIALVGVAIVAACVLLKGRCSPAAEVPSTRGETPRPADDAVDTANR